MQEQQLKKIIAEAMYAGGLMEAQKYKGAIHRVDYEPLIQSFKKMEKLLGELAQQSKWSSLDMNEIFPLRKEIETLTKLPLN